MYGFGPGPGGPGRGPGGFGGPGRGPGGFGGGFGRGPGGFGPPPPRPFGPRPFFGWHRPYYGFRPGCGCLTGILSVLAILGGILSLFFLF